MGQGVLYVYDRNAYLNTKLVNKDNDGNPVKLKDAQEIDAKGRWIEVTLKPTHSLIFHTGYGVDNPNNDDFKYKGNTYKKQERKIPCITPTVCISSHRLLVL